MRRILIRAISAFPLLLTVSAATADTLAPAAMEVFRVSEIAARNASAAQAAMQRYIIERDVPGAGTLTLADHRDDDRQVEPRTA